MLIYISTCLKDSKSKSPHCITKHKTELLQLKERKKTLDCEQNTQAATRHIIIFEEGKQNWMAISRNIFLGCFFRARQKKSVSCDMPFTWFFGRWRNYFFFKPPSSLENLISSITLWYSNCSPFLGMMASLHCFV